MRIFISGGCKNGKSTYAQKIAKAQQKEGYSLYYIATMKPSDKEDEARIQCHIAERDGMGFTTIEIQKNILNLCDYSMSNSSILLDSTTALLANEMFDNNSFDCDAASKISSELSVLFDRFTDIVIVSDYIYSDALSYDEWTEKFRLGLASIDRLCAKKCDIVLEACYGSLIVHKGATEYQKII